MRVDAALVTRSVFSRKLSLLQRLLGLLIETGKKKDPRNNFICRTLFRYSFLLHVLRFALASAVNTRIHSGQTVMQVNGQQVLYR